MMVDAALKAVVQDWKHVLEAVVLMVFEDAVIFSTNHVSSLLV